MTTTKHTPTPWTLAPSGTTIWADFPHDNPVTGLPRSGQRVAETCGYMTDENDAAHIVRCVNAHDELVTALRGLLDEADDLRETEAFSVALSVLRKVTP